MSEKAILKVVAARGFLKGIEIETLLKKGDIIAYDETARCVVGFRTEGDSAGELMVNGECKVFLDLSDPTQLLNVATLISAFTGFSFEPTHEYPAYNYAIKFI